MKNDDRERGIENLLRQRRVETRAADACPDADILAAWTDGGLHATESASVETHVSNCARCQAILAALVTPIPEAASAAPVSLWRRWQLGWLVPLTAAAAAVVLWVVVPNDAPVPVDQSARVAEAPVAVVAEPLRQDQAPAEPSQPAAQTSPQPAPAPARSAFADAPAAQELRREAASAEQKAAESPTAAAQEARDAQANRARALGQADVQTAYRPAAPPPPPPPASPVAAPPVAEPVAPPLSPPAVVAPVPVQGGVAAGQGAGRGAGPAGRGGAGGGRGNGVRGFGTVVTGTVAETVIVSVLSPDPVIRWRLNGAAIELSTNAGATWDPLQSGVTEALTAGSSPSSSVCWIVGRAGVVLVTTDMRTWRRVAFVETSDLTGVQATDAQTATVTTADGRRWRTTNGGGSWSTLQDF